ncbi:hypothetical protein FA15DRAFT_502326 [Coprinopsis marcescibilis]|uniref:Uncharacterized protein n=1 Tax=Coprinopsis marcescibilis TaxID=230819 RepID=A0A5C3KSG6_COPMA|nr:hypothetical protein FA15DRAFT_502326 [Coprinopsis marcescibilis]
MALLHINSLCSYLLLALVSSRAAQIPLVHQTNSNPSTGTKWRFDVPISAENTTSNWIFDGVSSLLQQWANTRYRNNHNVVPATVPIGTILYHGRPDHVFPTEPEWLATDPEHGYIFCRAQTPGVGCWMLTLAVTRPLKVLYFDGSSAAKMAGSLDVQDLIAFGDAKPEHTWREYDRIMNLCEWGKKYGLDGFVRMEMDFEIMLCDFTKGLETVSFLNLVSSSSPGPPLPPSQPPRVKLWSPGYRVLEAGQWHNNFPGETRINLDLTRLITFYDPELFPGLADARREQERWEHRVVDITKGELENFLHRLDDVLTGEPVSGSGVDWSSLYRVVIHRYSSRLEVLQYMFSDEYLAEPDSVEERTRRKKELAEDAHEYVTSMLSPYILHNVFPPASSRKSSLPFEWATPIFEMCATTHTKSISKSSILTYSERLLLQSVKEVLHEICRVLVGVWAEGIEARFKKPGYEDLPDFGHESLAISWGQKINALNTWLDWGVWVKCKPACSFEETCYLPTWPYFTRMNGRYPTPSFTDRFPEDVRLQWMQELLNFEDTEEVRQQRGILTQYDQEPEWVRPKPRCIRRVTPVGIPWTSER